MVRLLRILAIVMLARSACGEVLLPENPTASQRFAAEELNKYIDRMGGTTQSIRVTTLSDAYQLLEDAGVKFLSPQFDFYQGSAEFVPKKFELTPAKHAEPKLKYRKLYVEEGHSHTLENLKQMIEWMPKVGYNVLVVPTNYQGHDKVKWDNWREALTPELQKRDITIEVGGHGYQNFLSADMEDGKLFDHHPDWFGQDTTGKRRKLRGQIFCTSNTAAVEYLIKNVVAYLRPRPEIQIFDFWPPDGGKWCECDACKRLGTPPERQVILVRQLQERLRAQLPSVRLEVIAYSSYIDPPVEQKLDKDVLVDFCPISQQFDFQIDDASAKTNAKYLTALKAWRSAFAGDISIYSYYRKYAWDSMPVIIPHYMQKDLQYYATLPVQGVSTYSEPGDWGTYELNHFVLARLACDSDVDVDRLMSDFCAARYGQARDTALRALRTLEETIHVYSALPNVSLKAENEIAAALEKIEKSQREIAAATTTDQNKLAIARLSFMLEYAAKDLKIQTLRAAGADSTLIATHVRTLHAFLSNHRDEGVVLLQRITLPRLMKRYGLN